MQYGGPLLRAAVTDRWDRRQAHKAIGVEKRVPTREGKRAIEKEGLEAQICPLSWNRNCLGACYIVTRKTKQTAYTHLNSIT